MRLLLLRHGRTAYNDAHRYQGVSDLPLSPEGEAELRPLDALPEEVWVSPLGRARRTAELMFPGLPQTVVEDFREMNFGVFEGRSYQEMEHDPAYRVWVEGGCNGHCPGGESRGEFCSRVCAAFSLQLSRALSEGRREIALVAHGGVQMAVMERFALPERAYFSWNAPCGGGFLLEAEETLWRQSRKLYLLEVISDGKGGISC